MSEAHLKELIEENPNPTLEEEAAALDVKVEPTTPDIPEKFLKDGKPDYEALAKSYKELEAKLGSSKKNEEEPPAEYANDEGEGEEATLSTNEDEARKVTDSAGVDYDQLSREYWESGKLADGSYDALEKAGIPRALVDSYIEGQQALLNATRTSVFSEVGGEETYSSMTSWAAENLTPAEIEAYDKAVNSGNMNATLLAVKGLHARYVASEGQEPKTVLTGKATVSSDPGYKSWQQVQKAMQDPRYGSDPAYVAEVEAKLARSNLT